MCSARRASAPSGTARRCNALSIARTIHDAVMSADRLFGSSGRDVQAAPVEKFEHQVGVICRANAGVDRLRRRAKTRRSSTRHGCSLNRSMCTIRGGARATGRKRLLRPRPSRSTGSSTTCIDVVDLFEHEMGRSSPAWAARAGSRVAEFAAMTDWRCSAGARSALRMAIGARDGVLWPAGRFAPAAGAARFSREASAAFGERRSARRRRPCRRSRGRPSPPRRRGPGCGPSQEDGAVSSSGLGCRARCALRVVRGLGAAVRCDELRPVASRP